MVQAWTSFGAVSPGVASGDESLKTSIRASRANLKEENSRHFKVVITER